MPTENELATEIAAICSFLEAQNYNFSIIGYAIFQNTASVSKNMTLIKSTTDKPDGRRPKVIGGLTRQQFLDKLKLVYKNELTTYAAVNNNFLAFRQYFVDEESKENTLIAAGLLLLYYKQNEHRFEYTDFKLHIAPSKSGTYKSFTIEGTVKQLGNAIILQHEKIFGTTVIKTQEEFFGESVLSDIKCYNGAYITYTPANQTLHGEIIIARLDKNDPAAKNEMPTTEWAYSTIPESISEALKGKIRQL
jgi:hypothetical protein